MSKPLSKEGLYYGRVLTSVPGSELAQLPISCETEGSKMIAGDHSGMKTPSEMAKMARFVGINATHLKRHEFLEEKWVITTVGVQNFSLGKSEACPTLTVRRIYVTWIVNYVGAISFAE